MQPKENDAKKRSRLGVKNVQLLSFEEEDNQSSNIKIKSSHDVLKEDVRLSKRTLSSDESSQEEEVTRQVDSRKKVKELLPSEKRLESLKDQVSLMKAELKGKLKPKEEKVVQKAAKHVSLVDQIRNDYLKSGKVTLGKGKKTDKSFLQMETFKNILHEKSATTTHKVKKPEEKVQVECKLHLIKNCASCFDQFGVVDQDDDDDDDWMNTSLVFKKEVGANVYQPKPDDYTVIDPRMYVLFY